MTHFDDQDWLDFARGILQPERSAELKAHLSADCEPCRTAASRWQRVVELAALTSEPVPEDAVRIAKAAFYLTKAPTWHSGPIQLARLIFDSFLSPALAGTRSSWFGPRHCVYESGGYRVEFHLGAGRENDKGFLTGQIADPLRKSTTLVGSNVKLVQGPLVAAETSVNAMGEFMLELRLHDSQWILIEIPHKPPIAIPIPNRPN